MAKNKFTCPPQTPSGQGTFSDNLVGFQLVQGGGLTQGNFEFVQAATEKTNRTFNTGTFSDPINLSSLGIDSVESSKKLAENNFKVYPNFDLSQVSTFTLYGSMAKRMSASITNIINFFPAGIESPFLGLDYSTGVTAQNIVYDPITNETKIEFNISRLRNPFDIDFTENSQRNLSLREIKVSDLRDLTNQYLKYSLFYKGVGHDLTGVIPTDSLTNGILKIYVLGNLFSGQTEIYDNLIIRPNDVEVNKAFNENFDEVENFLLNRDITPIYTATFNVPTEGNDGTYFVEKKLLSWPLYGEWNIDIITTNFQNYLITLNDISETFDLFRTNLISRFLTTAAFKEFDTIGQKMEKVLQIYGRSFDETQKFITALSFMTSVNYNVGNDIPSQLLTNLTKTLGWSNNISPIVSQDLTTTVFGDKNSNKSQYPGSSVAQTPEELNYQYYRNIALNSAYLFKSKGTRKSVEILLKLIGAPEALIEFNEFVYVADQKINLTQFNSQYAKISGGTYLEQLPVLDPTNLYTIQGVTYTGFTTTSTISDVNITSDEYPMDENGYPYAPENSENYYFQIGSGWFEQTPQHRAPEEIDLTNSVFVGSNPNYQTKLIPYTYGQVYLERYRDFPFMDLGFRLNKEIDNNKSWTNSETGLRSNLDGNFNALYEVTDDRLVINVKNVDLFLNPGQGLLYDVWVMSRRYNYPIPNQGLNWIEPNPCYGKGEEQKIFQDGIDFLFMDGDEYLFQPTIYPTPESDYPQAGGVDSTIINPQPKSKTFFEFAQTFWKNMINVRNRQFITDGKTGGYPTLQSIYWNYIMSLEERGIPNDNFTYQTMIDYVNGLGDYWIRLVEQMIPATTIWNTGIKYENSIFHRQKFIWRRQIGCKLLKVIPPPIENGPPINPPLPTSQVSVPDRFNLSNLKLGKKSLSQPLELIIPPGVYIPSGIDGNSFYCKPCLLTTNIFTNNCPIESIDCPIYPPGNYSTFAPILGATLNNYLTANSFSLNDCILNTLISQWFIEIKIDGVEVYKYEFFNGAGYNYPLISYPTKENWYDAVIDGLNTLINYGYDYYLKDDQTAVIYNQVCSVSEVGIDFKLNMGINFTITCS